MVEKNNNKIGFNKFLKTKTNIKENVMDKFVKCMIGLITLTLILDLFDIFKFYRVNLICYLLLFLCVLYFVFKRKNHI